MDFLQVNQNLKTLSKLLKLYIDNNFNLKKVRTYLRYILRYGDYQFDERAHVQKVQQMNGVRCYKEERHKEG